MSNDRSNTASQHVKWMRYEVLLCLLGSYTIVALVIRAGLTDSASIFAILVTAAYAGSIQYLRAKNARAWQLLRLFAGYFFVLWYFVSVASFVSALGLTAHDDALLEWDERYFGVTPAVAMQPLVSPPMTELMSVLYFSFLIYLHVALIYFAMGPLDIARRFANWMFSVYAVGMSGYLLVPAIGPGRAFPHLFDTSLDGGILTQLNRIVVDTDSVIYDVFPSLHVLITCALLLFDYRYAPRRFRWMLFPAFGTCFAAIYLRYHYGVDMVAALALLAVVWVLFRDNIPPSQRRPSDVAAGH